jgi:preprotein translocase SecE subunit
MAIVKTTPSETGSGPNNGNTPEVPKVVDRTKSVVNQGGRATARPTRQAGMVVRRQPESTVAPKPRDFVDDTVAELKKVAWPTPQERVSGTIVTIGMLLFFSMYILGLDSLFRVIFIKLGILPPNSL